MSRVIAVADIGGTHARFALAEIDCGRVEMLHRTLTLKTAEHASFQTAWQAFGAWVGGPLPIELGMAFAGSVGGELLKLTNNAWVIRPALLQDTIGVERHVIVNDFGAVAHAVAELGENDFLHLFGPSEPSSRDGVTSVVGPGTGLGVAALLRRAGHIEVIETEGGHVDFAPLDALEDRILAHLRDSFRRVSIERVACGNGLANIYAGLAAGEGQPLIQRDDKELWRAALEGSDILAAAALDRFCMILGAFAGDLALVHGANAVVLAGGLGLKLRDRLPKSGFEARFVAKGRFKQRMAAIPVKLVTHPQPGLLGAAAAFAKAHP